MPPLREGDTWVTLVGQVLEAEAVVLLPTGRNGRAGLESGGRRWPWVAGAVAGGLRAIRLTVGERASRVKCPCRRVLCRAPRLA